MDVKWNGERIGEGSVLRWHERRRSPGHGMGMAPSIEKMALVIGIGEKGVKAVPLFDMDCEDFSRDRRANIPRFGCLVREPDKYAVPDLAREIDEGEFYAKNMSVLEGAPAHEAGTALCKLKAGRAPVDVGVPDTDRYIYEHGNGVTGAGIERGLSLLPAMLSVGYPDAEPFLDPYDMADIRSIVEDYKDECTLYPSGSWSCWCDGDKVFNNPSPAMERLRAQPRPGLEPANKSGVVTQAIVLSMTPDKDLMTQGYWHFLGGMATDTNMGTSRSQKDVARIMKNAVNTKPGPGIDGMAGKMSDTWAKLAGACRFEKKGELAEASSRMMQFCVMQNVAYLDGYDLAPDTETAKAIGRSLAGGIGDPDAFRRLMADSLVPHQQPEAQKETPERSAGTDGLSPMERMKRGLYRRDNESGEREYYVGPEL